MQTYGNQNVTYDWYAGNSRLPSQSGKFIAAHVAHAGLMCFWAGALTLFELARYDASLPMGTQNLILLPHLAGLGIGGIESGAVITDSYQITVVAILHLIVSAVYGAAGLLHSLRYKGDLGDYPEGSRPRKFNFEWDDPDRLTFILGHHLLFLALGCVSFVEWAKYHGIWDSAAGVTRTIRYNLDLGMIWNQQVDFLAIDNLEDVMGGHAFLAFFLSAGAIFHIFTKQFGNYTEFKGKGLLSAEANLAWACAGVGYMALVAAFWCSTNSTIYPVELYGDLLKLNFDFAPYFVDTDTSLAEGAYTARAWLSNAHFYLGFFFIQGHLWHALRAMGFDFRRIGQAFDNMDNPSPTTSS